MTSTSSTTSSLSSYMLWSNGATETVPLSEFEWTSLKTLTGAKMVFSCWKSAFSMILLKMGGSMWACNCSLVNCLNCWLQFSGKQPEKKKSVNYLQKIWCLAVENILEKSCREKMTAAGVVTLHSWWITLCHDNCTGSKWTSVIQTWYVMKWNWQYLEFCHDMT